MPKNVEIRVNVTQDVLTLPAAGSILSTLVKFLAVRRQQIPAGFSYQTFTSLVRELPGNRPEASCWSEIQLDKQRELACASARSYEKLLMAIDNAFGFCQVQEAALFFGATMFTPKEMWHVEFPDDMINHIPSCHNRKIHQVVHQTIKAIAAHEELTESFGRQFNPTNMYVMLKFADVRKFRELDDHFERKDLLDIPGMCHKSKIVLENDLIDSAMGNCCGNLRIDGASPLAKERKTADGEWYGFRDSVMGYKEVLVKGKTIWSK